MVAVGGGVTVGVRVGAGGVTVNAMGEGVTVGWSGTGAQAERTNTANAKVFLMDIADIIPTIMSGIAGRFKPWIFKTRYCFPFSTLLQ